MSASSRRRARRRNHGRRRQLLMRLELAVGMGLLPRPLQPDEESFMRRAIDDARQALRDPQLQAVRA